MSELYVVFAVGGGEYALPAAEVAQMESYVGATPTPGARPYVAGVIQVRGRVVPVVDLRARFGLPPAALTLDSRVVVVQRGEREVALLTDRAREVLRLLPDQLSPPPREVGAQAGGFVRAIARAGARLLMLLDVDKVITEES